MKEVIYSEQFRSFLQGVTGIELSAKVDISASKYWSGHQLLCHDDELEGRRIAFIFYMVPKDWSEEDGGTLDLFECCEEGQPRMITESILPAWNNFLFFEVSPTSFHQVAEILSSKERMTFSGWYHGAPIVRPAPYVEQPLPRDLISENPSVDLAQWINPRYLTANIQKQINRQFCKASSIELPDFLIQEKWEQLLQIFEKHDAALIAKIEKEANAESEEKKEGEEKSEKEEKKENGDAGDAAAEEFNELDLLPFELIGPANRRHYESLGRWTQPAAIHPLVLDAIRMFRSPELAQFLQSITGLTLQKMHSEVRRFSPGAYTLAQDNQDQHAERGLDAYYFLCPVDTWDIDLGGQITYMDEEDELATMIPSDNALSLVFRDVGCMKYVKYVNHEAPAARNEIALIFWEDPATLDAEDEKEEEDGDEKSAEEDKAAADEEAAKADEPAFF